MKFPGTMEPFDSTEKLRVVRKKRVAPSDPLASDC